MTKQLEQISALMDGEDKSGAPIKALRDDAELRQAWQRYHFVRSAMRQEVPKGQYQDISASIAAALDDEPVVFAPSSAKVSVLHRFKSRVVPFARQSGQFAVAASVAAAVILGVQTFNQPETAEPFATAPTVMPQGGLAPVSLNQTRLLPNESKQEVLETRRQIHALIADHEQQVKLKSTEARKPKNEDESPR